MTALWLRTTLRKQLLGHPRAMPGVWGRFARHRILPRKEFMGRAFECQSILLGRTPAANGPGSGQGRDPERGKSRIRQSQKYVNESPPLGNRQVVDAEPHGIPPIPARQ